jgi:hypothetical protein
MIRVAQWAVLCSGFLENKSILNSNMMILVSSTMILDRCSPVNSPWLTGQYSLFLLRICGGSSLLSINDR